MTPLHEQLYTYFSSLDEDKQDLYNLFYSVIVYYSLGKKDSLNVTTVEQLSKRLSKLSTFNIDSPSPQSTLISLYGLEVLNICKKNPISDHWKELELFFMKCF